MDQAKEAFLAYASKYDKSDLKVRIKIEHPLRVLALSTIFAQRLNLNEEDTKLINIISLLHDIGRFHQLEVVNSFQDDLFDHAAYGVKYLFDEGHIKEFWPEEKDYDIIKKAIYYHNKHVLEVPNFDERTNFFVKLIRDLDKIDILNTINLEHNVYFKKEDVPEEYFQEYFKGQSIKIFGKPNPSKTFILTCAYMFDLNFKESIIILKERKYLDKFIAKAQVDPDSQELFTKITDLALAQLEKEE